GEGRVDNALFTGLDANQGVFEPRDHATRTENQRHTLGGTASKGLAVDLAHEVDGDLVAVLGSAFDSFETGVLLAQHVQHGVDIGIADFSLRTLHGNAFEASQFDFLEHFERGNVFQILALFEHLRLDGRGAGRVQFLLDHGFVEGFLDQITQGLLTRSTFVTLTNDAHRHLARTEARNLGATGGLLQALVDSGFDAFGRHADGHPALKSGGGFYRNLHGFSSLHRRGAG